MTNPKTRPNQIKYKIVDSEGKEWGRFRGKATAIIEKMKLEKDFWFLNFSIVTA
ncbi:MAG: hypothetical protein ACOC56_03080 [Atribacterota bacterium]